MNQCELYYAHPVQVKYWDSGRQQYLGGIGYHDVIICGCCGKACPIDAIIDDALKNSKMDMDKAIVELSWVDIHQSILDK